MHTEVSIIIHVLFPISFQATAARKNVNKNALHSRFSDPKNAEIHDFNNMYK